MRYLIGVLLVIAFPKPVLYSYSVLTHEAIIDAAWPMSIEPLLLQRFPRTSAEQLRKARAYAYGGSIVQDMGYYPFGSRFFTDLVHYVRTGEFVTAMLRESMDLNEYAFALGSLAHYSADNNGHSIAVNRAVPMLYPKLRRKYGDDVTYADNPSAHLKTEFGFDVLEVAKGRYATNQYHDFIGFEVSKPLLERVFPDVYALKLEDAFGALDLAIGTYRKTVSGIIPEATKIAWVLKQDDIQKSIPGVTQERFLYNLSRLDYEREWGTQYRKPGWVARLLAFVIRIAPKFGPFRPLSFKTPTPETEKLFMESFNATLDRYRMLIAAERTRQTDPADVNLDLGKAAPAGVYKIADEAYAKLVDELSKRGFRSVPRPLRENILSFYRDELDGKTVPKSRKSWKKLRRKLELLQTAAAYSTP